MLKAGRKPAPSGAEPLERVQALYRSGRVEEAISGLRSLIEAQPKSARLRVLLSEWLSQSGRTEEAIRTLFELQELLIATDNLLAAISAGLKIVELDPSFENPLSYVAKVNSDRLRAEARAQKAKAEAPVESAPSVDGALQAIPLLSELSPEELLMAASGMRRRLLSKGAVVFSKGDESRSLCFVVNGLLEIRSEGKTLDTAEAGQCLGEFAFLTGEPRSADVVASEESEVLELGYDAMTRVVASHPRVATVLDRMYHRRVLARVLAESPLFESFSPGERNRLASKFEFLQVPAGIAVVEEGSEDSALFLVKSGSIRIRNRAGTELGTIGPNEFFGEVSFLTGVPRTASASTERDTELLRIDRDTLAELVVEHPRLATVLKEYHLDRVRNALQAAKGSARA